MKERSESEGWTGSLIFDSGDLFHDRFVVKAKERPMVEATASFLVAQYNDIGCHGFAPGDRDLVLGRALLTTLAKEAKFPFLAANLVDTESGKPVFDARAVHTLKGGVKVGVFGLTLKGAASKGESAETTWTVLDPVEVAAGEVQKLKALGADIVVALAHLSEKDEAQLAEKVPGITAILGGHGTRMLQHPEQVGKTFVADAFSKGKYVSVLTLNVFADNTVRGPFVDRFQKKGLEKKRTQVAARLKSYERIIERQAEKAAGGVSTSQPPRAGGPAPGFYEKQVEGFKAEIAALDAQLAAATNVDPNANYVDYELVALSKKIEHEADVDKAVLSFRKKFPKKPGH